MKKIIVILIALLLVLVACSGSEEAIALTETAAPSTTPRPTLTEISPPIPTETPVPTATLFPSTPTPELNEVPYDTYLSLLNVGDMFRDYRFLLTAEEIYTIMLEYDLEDSEKAEVLSNRALIYDWMGKLEAAIEDYSAASQLDENNALLQYSLCWDYSLIDQAEKGLPFCEKAVSLDPDPYYIDGRAIAYAMVGQFDDALRDLEIVIADLEENSPDSSALQMRVDWASALEQGENPFKPELLTLLKDEYTMMIDEVPVYVLTDVDYSRKVFQMKMEDLGFTFGEIEIEDGEEMLIGKNQDGDCQQGVKLVGPQEEIESLQLSVLGCSDSDTQGNISAFMGMFYYNPGDDEFVDSPWLGQLFAWYSIDVYYVIEELQTDPVSIEIENIRFTAVAKDKLYAVEITAEILP